MSEFKESMKITELMFGGSLVAAKDRPDGLLKALRRPIMEEDIEDDQVRMIFRAVQLAHEERWKVQPTPDNLALIIMQEGLVPPMDEPTPERVSARRIEIATQIAVIAESGVDTASGLDALAASIQEHTSTRRLYDYGKFVQDVFSDKTMVSTDRYEILTGRLEEVRPNANEPKIYTVRDQFRIMRELKKTQKALLGKLLMTFPAAWGITDYVPYILPGLMYIVSGLTGRGKSSMLQQVADWLADSGFTVLYFHAEDAIDRQMMRQAVRLEGASMMELVAGDPRNKYESVQQRLLYREKMGGGITYVHCMGQPVSFIRQVTRNLQPDVVIVDYLQKLNRAPQMKAAGGKDDAALALAADELKQIAEDGKGMVAMIVGSQETEPESAKDARQGRTFGSRQISHKAQVVLSLDVPLLTDEDEPEVVDGIEIAKSGELSGFGYMTVVKNNDGPQGFTPGVFNRNILTFKSIGYITWQRNNPGEEYPSPTLSEPGQAFYDNFRRKTEAWDHIDVVLKDPRTRRKEAKKTKKEGPANYNKGVVSEEDLPF